MTNELCRAAAMSLAFASPVMAVLPLAALATAEDGVSKERDPREDITSALKLYIKLLEEKQIDKFLEAALYPSRLKQYREPKHYKPTIDALNGPRRDLEIYLLRKALEHKPRLQTTDFLKKDIATFEWDDPKHGKAQVQLVKESGKWYLNW